MTGVYVRINRNGKWENIEIEPSEEVWRIRDGKQGFGVK